MSKALCIHGHFISRPVLIPGSKTFCPRAAPPWALERAHHQGMLRSFGAGAQA